jgi:methyl-accepting chemotaxis protein
MTKRLRFPMFLKFLVGCLTLAALLIAGSTYVLKNETRLKSRGNYLARGQRRLDGYIEKAGRGITGTVELLAADPELRAAIKANGDSGGISKRMHEILMSRNGVQPDIFVVFTPANHVVFVGPGVQFAESQLAELAAAEKVRTGSTLAHRVQVISGIPYQMSAVPVRAVGSDEIIAGILMGVKLERYYVEFGEQSDDDPTLRWRTSLIDNGQTVLASAWPADKRNELVQALKPDKVVRVQVGDDIRDVARMADGDYDFACEDVEGYKGNDGGTVGKQCITRSRSTLVDPADHMPWIEILIGVGLSFGVAFAMGFWITRPIKQMVKQSRGLLAGETDLSVRIAVKSRDETAELAENINQLFGRVHELAKGVQTAAFQVGASSAEISAASRQMLSGLKDQTIKIEGSTAAVTELSSSIQEVAGNAGKATGVAEETSHEIGSAVDRMNQIRNAVDDAATKMRELAESSKRIGNIVEVIRQISEQTSMLALNASIEAAHAGEQGRGFAVVADEVSSLARRVGQSAKDIEALIQTVKEQTQAAITSMEVGTREVVNGSQLVTSTLNGLGELITVVKDTAVAVREQAIVSDEIARNMDAVRHIAGEMLHGSEESVVQAERLHELAFDLEQSIGGFNLDGQQIGTSRDAKPKSGGGAPRQLPASSSAKTAAPGSSVASAAASDTETTLRRPRNPPSAGARG